jgi:hypothetical protein
MKEINYTNLYCVNLCDSILLRFRFRKGPQLNYGSGSCSATTKSYGSYGYGSGSETLLLVPIFFFKFMFLPQNCFSGLKSYLVDLRLA